MVNQPLISVVVPAYNAESFIGATIQSVVKQTYRNWELLVVDDCSTDGTRDLVSALAVRDERIQLITLTSNSNLPAVPRNKGIRRARGDFIAFLDHDDLWFKRKLERHVAAHQCNKAIAMTHSALLNYPNRLELRSLLSLAGPVRPMSSLERLRTGNTVMCSSAVVATEVISQLGGFNEDPSLRAIEDYELWLRIAKSYQIGYLPEVLGLYRDSHLSTSQLANMESRLDALRAIGVIDPPLRRRPLLTNKRSKSAKLPGYVWNYAFSGPVRGRLRLNPLVY